MAPSALAARVFDSCIVGSGASGAIVAHELARHGWDVVILEQGGHMPPGATLADLPAPERCRARDGTGRWGRRGFPWTACVVGGGTRFYCGVSFRMREVDFDASSHTVSEALDPRWPVRYENLRPYYDEVERLIGVARSNGGDPTEPPGATPPLPAHDPSAHGRLIAAAAADLRLHPFPTPLAIRSRGDGTCTREGPCDQTACPVGAKGDVASRILDRLMRQPNVTLATHTRALRLVESAPGRIEGLECADLRNRRRLVVRARTYVLAANAIQSAALLLRSSSRWSPRGVGNRSGLLGCGLSLKPFAYVAGHSHLSSADGLFSTVALTDYYVHPSFPTGLGGLIYEANPAGAEPRLRVECLVADQPLRRNRVRITRTRDAFGLPELVIDYRPHPIDLARLAQLSERGVALLRHAGASAVEHETPAFTLGSGHLSGTCRPGADGATGVVDAVGTVHDGDAVVVADGATHPFGGAVNPTLTIQANALRIGRALALR